MPEGEEVLLDDGRLLLQLRGGGAELLLELLHRLFELHPHVLELPESKEEVVVLLLQLRHRQRRRRPSSLQLPTGSKNNNNKYKYKKKNHSKNFIVRNSEINLS